MIKIKYGILPLVIILIAISCKRDNRSTETPLDVEDPPATFSKISHVTFYIENSGSMEGYVNGATEFVEVVNKLAQYPGLIPDDVSFSYNMVSGKASPLANEKKLKVYDIGNDASILKSSLTKAGLKKPTSGRSDLNEMFKIALNKAKADSISILISDGIYDVGGSVNPLNSLITEVQSTTTNFIQRLKKDNIETLLIKLESDFDGLYHPANVNDPSGKSVSIKQKRPYYIWIFGNSYLLNKSFPENELRELNGYVDIARFRKLTNQSIPYEATGYKILGFKPDSGNEENNSYELYKNVMDSSFFNIAVNYSDLKISSNYLTTVNNYNSSSNYAVVKIVEVEPNPPNDLKPYLQNLPFKATHIISISTKNPPETGKITISLKNIVPDWIEESSVDNDYPFNGSTTQTFGFKTLIGGIEEAYEEMSSTENLTQFNILIKN